MANRSHRGRQTLRRAIWGIVLLLVAAPIAWSKRQRFMMEPNVPYDGKFTFVRLRYTQGYRMAWSADYAQMERNFMSILSELSTLTLHKNASNVHTLDDPELFKYPVAYLTEPGYWMPTEDEAAGLRNWIAKGGFLASDLQHLLSHQDVRGPDPSRVVASEGRISRDL